MNYCALCNKKYANWKLHEENCESKDIIESQSPKFIYTRDCIFCKDCCARLNNQEVVNHRKNCKKKQRSSKTKSLSERFNRGNKSAADTYKRQFSIAGHSNAGLSLSLSQVMGDEYNEPLLNLNKIKQGFTMIGDGMIRVFVDKWLDQKNTIHPMHLTKLFTSSLSDTFKLLHGVGKDFTMESLKKYLFLIDIIKAPNDIFAVSEVSRKIQSLNLKEKQMNEIYGVFNRFLNDFRIEEKYKTAHVHKATHKIRYYLLYKELISFVLELFKSKVDKKIHLGLDLLIIFHSGQRFPSSRQIVQNGIVQMLKGKKTYFQIQQSTKTKNESTAFFDEKLIGLLKQFKWTNFLLTGSHMKNIKRYLNFSLITLRRGMYIEGVNQCVNKLDPSILTGHRSKSVSNIYVDDILRKFKQQFHNKIKIPTTQDEYDAIKQIDLPHKIKPILRNNQLFEDSKILNMPKLDVFDNINTAKAGSPEQIGFDLILSSDEEPDAAEQRLPEPDKNAPEATNEKKEELDLLYEDFIAENIVLKRSNLRFNFAEAFVIEDDYFICIYCRARFDKQPDLFCSCFRFTIGQGVRVTTVLLETGLQLKMPGKYINRNNHLFNEVRYLLHRRGFYVTNTAISESDMSIDKLPKDITRIHLPQYNLYKQGKYFCPLLVMLSGDGHVGYSGVGLVAIEDIDKHVFIGQYGGDIRPINQTILLKRKDMNMDLHDDLQICAFKHISFVQLINSSKQFNCSSIKCVVNEQLKIIIFSERKIKAGEELLYYYEGDFQQQFEHKLVSSSRIFKKKPYISLPNGCFANALQFVLQNIYGSQLPEPIRDKRKCVEDFYRHHKFSLHSQQDFHEYLTYVLEKVCNFEARSNKFIHSQKTITCSSCKLVFTVPQKSTQILLGIDSPTLQLTKHVPAADYRCEYCSNTTVTVVEEVTYLPDYFFVFIQRIDLFGNKIQGKCSTYPKQLHFSSNTFELRFAILHLGENNKGHYIVIDKMNNKIFDDGVAYQNEYNEEDLAYALVYKKKTIVEIDGEPAQETMARITQAKTARQAQTQDPNKNKKIQKQKRTKEERINHEIHLKLRKKQVSNPQTHFLTPRFGILSSEKYPDPLDEASGTLILKGSEPIFQLNQKRPFYLASITKLLALLAATEIQKEIGISDPDIVEVPSYQFETVSELQGCKICFYSALRLMVSISANDMALGLYSFFEQRKINLIDRMKVVASQLKMSDSHFEGCTGLEQNFSTCLDVAKLFFEVKRRGLEHYFKNILPIEYSKDNKTIKTTLQSKFRPPYPINMFKTGLFLNGKESIVFEAKNKQVVVVLLNHRSREDEMRQIRTRIEQA